MPIKATDLKRGNALIWEGQLHVVIGTEHTKPGKGSAYVQAKMKNVATGTIKVNRINSSDKVEDVSIDKRKMEFLYTSGPNGPRFYGPRDVRSKSSWMRIWSVISAKFLKENTVCEVQVFDEKPLGIELPAAIDLEITETTPQPKVATVTNQLKKPSSRRSTSACLRLSSRAPSFASMRKTRVSRQGSDAVAARNSRTSGRAWSDAAPSVRPELLARSRQDH